MMNMQIRKGLNNMDEETKKLLRNIAHHLKWVIVLLFAILAILLADSVGGYSILITNNLIANFIKR